jgi:hypothetical protein
MASLGERWSKVWDNIRQAKAKIPARVIIPKEHVENENISELGIELLPDEHYFQVRINEMFLATSRQWWVTYCPMVFAVSEFSYGKETEAVPFVVGPAMMEKYGKKYGEVMVFSDTRVAGLHPYRGGRLNLSVVLCRVKRDDYAMKILQMLESAAGALDFATALGNYLKVANVVMGGVEAIMGLNNTQPLVGYRKEFDPDAHNPLKESYFALIDAPESQVTPDQLWVHDNQLFYGKSKQEAYSHPFRQADYILYSIAQTKSRSDVNMLPIYPLWENVQKEAMVPTDENWKRAKSIMATLYESMVFSPDLIPSQVDELYIKYTTLMKKEHERAVNTAALGPEKGKPSEVELRLRKANQILDM